MFNYIQYAMISYCSNSHEEVTGRVWPNLPQNFGQNRYAKAVSRMQAIFWLACSRQCQAFTHKVFNLTLH